MSIFWSRIWSGLYIAFIYVFCLFKKDFIYLFLERGEGEKKERERNIHVWLPLEYPLLGTQPKSRYVPWQGIEPATLWFIGRNLVCLLYTSDAADEERLV